MAAKTKKTTSPYTSSYDPGLQPISPKSYKAGMDAVLGQAGTLPAYLRPRTQQQLDSEATGYVGSVINPQIDQITKGIAARSKAGSDAIGKYTGDWADYLGGEADRVGKPYDEAISGEQGDMSALAQFLGRTGDASKEALQKKISDTFGSEDSSAQQQTAAHATGDAMHGAAGNVLARGDSQLAFLRSSKAADVAGASKLPGIAHLGGLKSLRTLAEQLNTEQKDSIDKVQATVPGLTADIGQRLSDRNVKMGEDLVSHRENRASLLGDYLKSTQDRELQKTVGRQGFANDSADFGLRSRQLDQSQTGIDQENTRLSQQQQTIDQSNAAQQETNRHNRAGEKNDAASVASAKATARQSHFTTAERTVDNLFGGLIKSKPASIWLAPNASGTGSHVVPPGTPGAIETPNPSGAKVTSYPKWSDAINQGYNLVAQDLLAQGYTHEEIRQMVIAQALALHIPGRPAAPAKKAPASAARSHPTKKPI